MAAVGPRLKVVALLTVRNEVLYLRRCLEHLVAQGIEACVIDNGSQDATREIAETFLGRGVLRIEALPYRGCFELARILENEERLASDLGADWLLHQDADEIREAPDPHESLAQAIERVDRAGFNAIDFDEFVFPPTADEGSFAGRDYVAEMRHYYFFAPRPLRRVTAWRKSGEPVRLVPSAGHAVDFPGRRIAPEPFVLRHYVALDRSHLVTKYAGRRYARVEIEERGWHRARASFDPERLVLPRTSELKRLGPDGRFERSEPWRSHPFFAPRPFFGTRPETSRAPGRP